MIVRYIITSYSYENEMAASSIDFTTNENVYPHIAIFKIVTNVDNNNDRIMIRLPKTQLL